jgi:hypothetical protein
MCNYKKKQPSCIKIMASIENCLAHMFIFCNLISLCSFNVFKDALELMGLMAVVVNCALIGVSGQIKRMLPVTELSTTIIIIVILEVNRFC